MLKNSYRRGKMDGSGQVNQVVGPVKLTRIFQNFFFFQLQKQINDNLFRENE